MQLLKKIYHYRIHSLQIIDVHIMKRYGKYSEKYETIVNGTGLLVKKKEFEGFS